MSIYGKAIRMVPLGAKGIVLGYSNELSPEPERKCQFVFRVWDPNDRQYFTTVGTEYDIEADPNPETITMSKGDWERMPDYITAAMDVALFTEDYKWAARLHRFEKIVERRVAEIQQQRKEAMKKKEPKPEPPRPAIGNANGIELGMEVFDTTNRVCGAVTGFTGTHNLLALVNIYDHRTKQYIQWERHIRYLRPAPKSMSLSLPRRDTEFLEIMGDIGGDLALDSKDAEWFKELQKKRPRQLEKLDNDQE